MRHRAHGGAAGWSVAEALVVLALGGLALAASVPALTKLRQAGRGAAGARLLATQLQASRWQSVASHRGRGLDFRREGGGWVWYVVEDGNGNGVRTAELRSGTDRVLSGPHRLQDFVAGVRLGFPHAGPFPEIPPKTGTIPDTDDPVKFGRSDLVGFSPRGDASSGTLYLTDGADALYAVVLFGPTARVRVWRYEARSGRWVR